MRFEETDYSSPSLLDFVPRDRRNQSIRLVIGFIITAICMLVLNTTYGAENSNLPLIFSIFMLGLLCAYTVVRLQRCLDLLTTTEYQNLLFSQSLACGTSFYLLVRRNGAIVHVHSGLGALFANANYSDSRALETIFSQGGMGKDDRERILGAIHNHLSERIVFSMTLPSGDEKSYMLTVEPLARPAGYLLVRGREYHGERAGSAPAPAPAPLDIMHPTSTDSKRDHMLEHTPIAHYATDAFGRFEYANSALEKMLGYEPGALIEQRHTLKDILFQVNEKTISDDYTIEDYSGKAVIEATDKKHFECILFQTLMRDEQGKPIGATGTILRYAMRKAEGA